MSLCSLGDEVSESLVIGSDERHRCRRWFWSGFRECSKLMNFGVKTIREQVETVLQVIFSYTRRKQVSFDHESHSNTSSTFNRKKSFNSKKILSLRFAFTALKAQKFSFFPLLWATFSSSTNNEWFLYFPRSKFSAHFFFNISDV
jgi:hypothetical protein